MVQPITGPFVQQHPVAGPDSTFTYVRVSNRQKPPHNLRLPFSYTSGRRISWEGTGAYLSDPANVAYGPTLAAAMNFQVRRRSTLEAEAHAAAYRKLTGKLSSDIQLAVTFLERRQAAEMIATRLSQLRNLFRKVSPEEYRRLQRKADRETARSRVRAGASTHLEISFGWTPLIQEIYALIDFLQSPVPPLLVRARGATTDSYVLNPGDDSGTLRSAVKSEVGCQMIVEVQVDNPLLWWANSLGLVNPVGWAWERIPYSFLVDYFVNVQEFLHGPTTFVGLAQIEPTTTWFRKLTLVQRQIAPYWLDSKPGRSIAQAQFERIVVERVKGISAPKLVIKPFNGFSLKRGSNMIALLLQTLRDKK